MNNRRNTPAALKVFIQSVKFSVQKSQHLATKSIYFSGISTVNRSFHRIEATLLKSFVLGSTSMTYTFVLLSNTWLGYREDQGLS